MAALEREPGGVALVLQGAGGDRTHTAQAQDDRALAARAFGERVTGRAREALAREGPRLSETDLGLARVRFSLPRAEAHVAPRLLRPLASNVLSLFAPATAPAWALALGPVTFLAAPGEPVAAVGRACEHDGATEIALGLVGGYIGYVELADEVQAGTGESARTYFEPALAERVTAALAAAASAALATPAP